MRKNPPKEIILIYTSTPQLPFKTPQIPSNRDHKALNRGTLGGLGRAYTWDRYTFVRILVFISEVFYMFHRGSRTSDSPCSEAEFCTMLVALMQINLTKLPRVSKYGNNTYFGGLKYINSTYLDPPTTLNWNPIVLIWWYLESNRG